MNSIERRIKLERPKRLLSIDGGGIRGIIAAQILKQMETIICAQNPRWQCLADYFDFIGGTSTGSIIAAGLATGMKVDDILSLYKHDGRAIFQQNTLTEGEISNYFAPYIDEILKKFPWGVSNWWWVGGKIKEWLKENILNGVKEKIPETLILQIICGSKYNSKPLEEKIKEKFGDTPLGSEQLKTLLMITAKNVTTDKTWFFVNNPSSKFFSTNSQILLRDIVRASSAAPTYFPPHCFKVGEKEYGFVDGGMSMFNNPSFRLFLEATLKDYKIGWETGTEKLLMISVGTGFSNELIEPQKVKEYKLPDWANYTVGILMEDANAEQNLLMKLIGNIPNPGQINSEMSAVSIPPIDEIQQLKFTPLLTYRRYTTSFTRERFEQLAKYGLPHEIEPKLVEPMDCIDQIDNLCKIGEAIAKEQVSEKHFEGFLHDDY